MIDVLYPGTSRDPEGLALVVIGFFILAWGIAGLSSSIYSAINPFNREDRFISSYTLVMCILGIAVGIVLSFIGYDTYREWLGAHHTFLDEPDVPMRFLGMTLRYSHEHYMEAIDKSDIVFYELVIFIGIGIFITFGSIGAILMKDFAVIPMRIHFLGVLYGIGMTLLMSLILYGWLNAVAGELYTFAET